MDDDVITQAEAARILGVSRSRVEQLIDAGLLPAVERMEPARYLKRSDVERFKTVPRRPGRPRKPEGASDAT
jgi:excisionase family DNA binding protein